MIAKIAMIARIAKIEIRLYASALLCVLRVKVLAFGFLGVSPPPRQISDLCLYGNCASYGNSGTHGNFGNVPQQHLGRLAMPASRSR